MNFLSRTSFTAFAALSLCLPAGAQDIDPYALYEAVKSGELELETPPAKAPVDTPMAGAGGERGEMPAEEQANAPRPDIPLTDAPRIEAGAPPTETDPQAVNLEGLDSRKPEIDIKAADGLQIDIKPAELDVGDTDTDASDAAPSEDDLAPPADETVESEETPEPETETSTAQAAPKTDAPAALPAFDDQDQNTVDTAIMNRADIAPYFLSAKAYLKLRGDAPQIQTRLIYSVAQTEAGDDETTKTFDVALAIGKDYVARQSTAPGSGLRIYDFRYNRLLTVTPGADDDAPSVFQNAPLYARAHSNTSMVAGSTQNGKLETLDLPGGVTLDAFWIESAMSWAMTDRASDIVLTSDIEGASLTYKDQPVFNVTLSGEDYADPDQSDAMLAFAHWDLPIHPTGLKQLYAAAPVETMTIVSKSPGAPDGQSQVWTLKSTDTSDAVFPLPQNAVNTLSGGKANPIAFVMNRAARGLALSGPPQYDDLADAVITAMNADDYEGAWLAAKRYETFSRPCKKNNIRKACKVLRDIEDMRKKPESLDSLLQAYEDSEDSAKRVKALQALKPWLMKDDVPADILRLAGVMRAKIDTGTAKVAGVDAIKARPLLQSALMKDPYNPQAYLAMAQYYAASRSYDEAWNVFDTLRSSISQDRKEKFTVDKVERGLQDRAPGYFAPAVMAER